MDNLKSTAKISIMVKHALVYRRITGELPTREYFVECFDQPRELVDQVYVQLALLVPQAVLDSTMKD